MCPAMVTVIVTRETLVRYWPVFPLSPVVGAVPEVFANIISTKFPCRAKSGEWQFLVFLTHSLLEILPKKAF